MTIKTVVAPDGKVIKYGSISIHKFDVEGAKELVLQGLNLSVIAGDQHIYTILLGEVKWVIKKMDSMMNF